MWIKWPSRGWWGGAWLGEEKKLRVEYSKGKGLRNVSFPSPVLPFQTEGLRNPVLCACLRRSPDVLRLGASSLLFLPR